MRSAAFLCVVPHASDFPLAGAAPMLLIHLAIVLLPNDEYYTLDNSIWFSWVFVPSVRVFFTRRSQVFRSRVIEREKDKEPEQKKEKAKGKRAMNRYVNEEIGTKIEVERDTKNGELFPKRQNECECESKGEWMWEWERSIHDKA